MSVDYTCPVCGSSGKMGHRNVLDEELIAQWGLEPSQVEYIDRQQGTHCTSCGSNLRAMAIANALTDGRIPFWQWLDSSYARALDILDANGCGALSAWLVKLPRYRLVQYPEVKIESLPFPDRAFDLVLHSDTLEHVNNLDSAMKECYRVLRYFGRCIFTVPMIVERLSRDRTGLDASYHGYPEKRKDCLVNYEFGADVWTLPIQVGFSSCEAVAFEYPSAIAWVAKKTRKGYGP